MSFLSKKRQLTLQLKMNLLVAIKRCQSWLKYSSRSSVGFMLKYSRSVYNLQKLKVKLISILTGKYLILSRGSLSVPHFVCSWPQHNLWRNYISKSLWKNATHRFSSWNVQKSKRENFILDEDVRNVNHAVFNLFKMKNWKLLRFL